jgi:aminomethyltransferase
VRTAAGLFDVSHMGEIEIRGSYALALLQNVTCNDVSALQDGQAQYSALMLPNGACIDDCVVHRFSAEHYFICVNAANTDRDYDWIVERNTFGADVENVSSQYSQIALQGPKSAEILKKLTSSDPSTLKYYWFRPETVAGIKGILARTGYTGEDGFEFYFPPKSSAELWNALLNAGKEDGLIPAGLGARNTLRLEAGYPLYGHELDPETTLIEAGLGWIVKLAKGAFIGSDVLKQQKTEGARKKLIGFEMIDPAPARDDYPVLIEGRVVGKVTSGSPSPFLKKNIGLAYVPAEFAQAGREIEIQVRARQAKARIVSLPFYKRLKK